MSISLEHASPPSVSQRALGLLKGKDNPFEILAAGQRADDNFHEIHVPALHQRERELLFKIIDTYRLGDYSDSDRLQKTRVVTVQGARGSGKTHLLQSLVARPDQKPQLVVRPAFFEPSLPFEEYLLAQLRTALAQQTEFHAERPLDAIARGLTRRLLLQALLGTTPADRLLALHADRPLAFRLYWGGGNDHLRRFDALIVQLKDLSARDLPALLAHFGLSATMSYRLVDGHLRAREAGPDLLVQMRRLFYSALARFVLLADHDAVSLFFTDNYCKADPTGTSLRADLVQCLLYVLLEACTLVRMPIVVAFDNLERLFASQNQFDGALIRTFLNNLAQATDSTRGLLFLLFAESGLFAQQVVPYLDDFARPRIEQGVPILGQGPVHLVRLVEPTAYEVEQLVQTRVRPLLSEMEELDSLPAAFPFTPQFLKEVVVGQGSVSLRNILILLRDEYNRIVYTLPVPGTVPGPGLTPDNGSTTGQGTGPVTPPPPPDWPGVLDWAWNRSFQGAKKWVESMSHHDLHNCLGALLQSCIPLTIDEWDLNKVTPIQAAGEHLEYGVVTLLDWKVRDGAVVKGPQSLRVAVGFLLAAGPGLPHDLRAKFDYLRDRYKGVRLVILWQTTREDDPLVDALPQGTRKVWDEESDNHWRSELRRVDEIEIRRILAFQELREKAEEAVGQPPPAEAVRTLLHKKVNKVFPLLRPPAVNAAE
jgi:hypothetical protein